MDESFDWSKTEIGEAIRRGDGDTLLSIAKASRGGRGRELALCHAARLGKLEAYQLLVLYIHIYSSDKSIERARVMGTLEYAARAGYRPAAYTLARHLYFDWKDTPTKELADKALFWFGKAAPQTGGISSRDYSADDFQEMVADLKEPPAKKAARLTAERQKSEKDWSDSMERISRQNRENAYVDCINSKSPMGNQFLCSR